VDEMLVRWPEAKKELKRRYWTPLWSECRGNVTQIAKRSGMQRKAVRDALREVGLDVDDSDDGHLPT
jgi:DNA-binding NtrC family response regulator